MCNKNFIYLLNDALENNHLQRALDAVHTFKAADLADILTQLPLSSSQILLVNLPARAYVFSYLKPQQTHY